METGIELVKYCSKWRVASSELMKLCKQSEVAEHDRRRAHNVLAEEKYDLDRVRFHISTALRHSIELQRRYQDVNQLSFRLRDEEEQYALICLSEREAAEDLRSQAEKAESNAARVREDLDVMLGTWVNDCVGASRGNTGGYQLPMPLAPQLRSVVEEGRGHPRNVSKKRALNDIDYMFVFK